MPTTFIQRRMFSVRPAHLLLRAVAVSGLLAALVSGAAHADDVADINRFLRAGQHAEALQRADAFLARNPRDAQMRFLKGVILAEQNKASEAIAIFSKLTEDYPSLPEPYNNLAVLYAASGQYEKARATLNAAIRTNASYATAYENLGDVHAKLASQAYDKALQLDSDNSAAKSKLTLVRSLTGNAGDGKLASAPQAAAPAGKPMEQSAASRAEAAKPADRNAAAKPEPVKPADRVAAAKPETAKPEPAKTPPEPPRQLAKAAPAKPEAAKPEPAKAANDSRAERAEIAAIVGDWAKAWSSQDVRSYLGHYGSDFQVPGGQSRKSWEDDRRARIVGKGSISVKVEAPQVTVNGNTATVRFRQIYISDRLTANTRKTLVFGRQGGKWKIKQETTGS